LPYPQADYLCKGDLIDMQLEKEKWFGDCLELMNNIGDKTIDMVLCDLPFEMTACKWDKNIPIEPLWKQYERIVKDNGAIVLFAVQPFSSLLVNSNLKNFRYEWVWCKHQATNPSFFKRGPGRAHESLLVFYNKQPTYNPQIEYDKPYGGFKSRLGKKIGEAYGDNMKSQHRDNPDGERYPVSFLYFSNPNKGKVHPNQKPLGLCEYMIKTYTNVGDLVLDNSAGSGMTGVAARNLGRGYILIEKDQEIFNKMLI